MKKSICAIIIVTCLFCTGLSFGQEKGLTPGSNHEKISLDIKGMDIVDVLKMLATRAGINIVVGKNVTGRVTLFLKDVELWDAFEIILLANDLAYEKKGNIINVMAQRDYELQYGERYQDKKQAKIIKLRYAKAADLSRALNQIKTNIGKIVVDEGSNTIALIDTPEKIQEMEDFIDNTDLPVQTKVFNLNYAQADKIQAKIQEILTKGVGSLKIDERTNKVLITDYPEKIKEVSNLINAFDEKTPQVLIDAQIIEIRPSDKLEMGVDWNFWLEKNFKLSNILPTAAGPAGRLFLGTPSIDPTSPGQFKAIIDMLRTIGDTKILSSPRIMALNNQEARILVGSKEAYLTESITTPASGSPITAETVNFVDVGIKLYVTPTINHDGFVTMKIRPEISSNVYKNFGTDAAPKQVPVVTTSEAETSVMVKDGVTIIIGGLQKDQRTKSESRIPFFGKIPILGMFFRKTSDDTTKTDLVILLTPHILSGEVSYTEFSDLKPNSGVVVNLKAGEIIKEKFSQPSALEREPSEESGVNYYKSVSDKVRTVALINGPKGEKGRIELAFTLDKDGYLITDPYLINSDNDRLTAFAIQAVKKAAPFAPFPDSTKKTEETFRISLVYE